MRAPGLQIVEFGRLTDALRADLEGDEEDPFDSAGSALRYQPKQRHVALRGPDGRLVASTGMVVVDVAVGNERFPVVGFGGVIVNAEHRGRGLARRVLEVALGKAGELGPEFVLLFCHENRSGLYRKLGFAPVGDEVIVQQPAGEAPMTLMTMWRALRSGAAWPAGRVVLQGLPF